MAANTAVPMLHGDTAGPAYWDRVWEGRQPERYAGPIYEFHGLYCQYLPRTPGLSLLEIGAVPGNHLVYFAREFGYRVSGIDYSAQFPLIEATLALNGVQAEALFNEDVFRFEAPRKYDIVFSSGFVEHFDPPEPAIELHARLVASGGMLILTVPNTRFLHKWLMSMSCPEVLAVHNPVLMNRRILSETVERCGMQVLFCDYLLTFRPFYKVDRWLELPCRAVGKALRIAHLDWLPNRFASPYLYLVARKAS
jgi:SAM-dependent methyltransferase